MHTPFPGMDPYLEHPAFYPGFNTCLVVYLANQLTKLLRPHYLADIAVRRYFENPRLEIGEKSIALLDVSRGSKVVTVIDIVSPQNKSAGPGRTAYRAKQRETLSSECHLVEIDLLRRGQHVLALPVGAAREHSPYDYLISVNRWPNRKRFELVPCRLRERLPCFSIPLSAPDVDAPLDLQKAFEQVYDDGSYMLRVQYDQPCEPRLRNDDQRWAAEQWAAYRAAHPEWFAVRE